MLSKNRRNKIKKSLKEFNSNKELISLYDELIKRYEDIKIEQDGILESWQSKELISWKRKRLLLFRRVEAVEKGINCLNKTKDDRHEKIVKQIYINGYMRAKVAQEVSCSEPRVSQILEESYVRLDKFII